MVELSSIISKTLGTLHHGIFYTLILSTSNLLGYDQIIQKNYPKHVYYAPRDVGEQMICKLARTADKEDAWVYVNGVWHDVGFGETDLKVCTDTVYINSVTKNTNEVLLYHMHVFAATNKTLAPPSTNDLFKNAWDLFLARRTKKKHKQFVIDGYGVWEYRCDNVDGIDPNGKKLIKTIRKRIARSINRKKPITEQASEWVEKMCREGIYLNYRPIMEK